MGHSGLFFFSFVFSTVNVRKNLPMSGFELWTSGVLGDRYANCVTTIAPFCHFFVPFSCQFFADSCV